jgi:flagellar basal body-associated protein FliL
MADAPAEGAPEGKKKPPLLLIVLGVQLVVLLGAVGFLAKESLTRVGPDVSLNTLRERAIQSIQDDVSQVQMIELSDIQANLPGSHVLKTQLQLEVSNLETKSHIEKRMSAVKARIIEVMSRQSKDLTSTFQGKLLLKDAIREAVNQELFEQGQTTGVVRDVFFMEIILI